MLKALATVLALLLGQPAPEFSPAPWSPLYQDAACCKVCKKGKACGDTCIKATYNCTKPPGCACNG